MRAIHTYSTLLSYTWTADTTPCRSTAAPEKPFSRPPTICTSSTLVATWIQVHSRCFYFSAITRRTCGTPSPSTPSNPLLLLKERPAKEFGRSSWKREKKLCACDWNKRLKPRRRIPSSRLVVVCEYIRIYCNVFQYTFICSNASIAISIYFITYEIVFQYIFRLHCLHWRNRMVYYTLCVVGCNHKIKQQQKPLNCRNWSKWKFLPPSISRLWKLKP